MPVAIVIACGIVRIRQGIAGEVGGNVHAAGRNVELDTKDGPVLLQDFLAMNFDIGRLGSGGDFDPDDAIVDWMQTDSKFNSCNLPTFSRMAKKCQCRRAPVNL